MKYPLPAQTGKLTHKKSPRIEFGKLISQSHDDDASVMVDEFVQQIYINKRMRLLKTVIYRYIIDPSEGVEV